MELPSRPNILVMHCSRQRYCTRALCLAVMLLSLSLIAGCTSQEQRWRRELQSNILQLDGQLIRLKQHLEQGHIRNALVLTQYSKVVASAKPELAELTKTLAMDATTEGPLYQGLAARMEDMKAAVKTAPQQGPTAVQRTLEEMDALYVAASPSNYNMVLTDPINVLADMSDGKLARVEAMSKEASLASNGAEDYGAGSQLVGNPNYGHWQTNSGGSSFWVFYGQYRLFSDLFGGRRIYYDDWSRHRNYSYYSDVGRSYYTSRNQRTQMQEVETRTRKNFQRQGKTFNSPYAKPRTGATNMARSSVTQAPSKFSSAYARGSSAASRSSSSNGNRSSTYNSRNFNTSRSSRGGK